MRYKKATGASDRMDRVEVSRGRMKVFFLLLRILFLVVLPSLFFRLNMGTNFPSLGMTTACIVARRIAPWHFTPSMVARVKVLHR